MWGKREEKPQRTTHAVGGTGARERVISFVYLRRAAPEEKGPANKTGKRSLLMVQAGRCGAIIHRRDTMYYALTKKMTKKQDSDRDGGGKKDERQKSGSSS